MTRLKREIRKHLAQQWNIRPEIRESFNSNDDEVSFSLVAKISDHAPCELITLKGKRLKPTRIKAYQEVLQKLEQGTLQIEALRYLK